MMSTTEATTNHVNSIQKPSRKNVVVDRVTPELAPEATASPSPTVGPPQRAPSTTFLRLSAGTIYFFFGFLKFFPDLSPAETLASQAVMRLTFGMLDAQMALFLLAIMECVIGICFLFNLFPKGLFLIFMFHQAATFTPLFLYPEICFKFVPFAPTMEGQYILKNLISVAAGWTILLPAMKASWAQWFQKRELRKMDRKHHVEPVAIRG